MFSHDREDRSLADISCIERLKKELVKKGAEIAGLKGLLREARRWIEKVAADGGVTITVRPPPRFAHGLPDAPPAPEVTLTDHEKIARKLASRTAWSRESLQDVYAYGAIAGLDHARHEQYKLLSDLRDWIADAEGVLRDRPEDEKSVRGLLETSPIDRLRRVILGHLDLGPKPAPDDGQGWFATCNMCKTEWREREASGAVTCPKDGCGGTAKLPPGITFEAPAENAERKERGGRL